MKVLENRAVIVTGSGCGIGRAYAIEMAKEGAKVVVDNRTVSEAEKVVGEVRKAGGIAIANSADVASWSETRDMVRQAID